MSETARLSRRRVQPSRNGDAEALTGAEIILAYFREQYRPDYRRGNVIHAFNGQMVRQAIACVPDFTIIAQLAAASDAPEFKGGGVNRDSLPHFFKKWAPVAWGQLLAELPDEEQAALGADSLAAEEFRQLVRDALLSEVTLGDVIDGTSVTQTQRCSLIDWAVKFAKPGPWRSVRSKKCWCKCEVEPDGEIVLRVAVRQALFGQVHADRRLCGMTQNTFTKLAVRYGVGTTSRDARCHGLAAVVLSAEFLETLTAGLVEPVENLADPGKAKDRADTGQESDPSEMA